MNTEQILFQNQKYSLSSELLNNEQTLEEYDLSKLEYSSSIGNKTNTDGEIKTYKCAFGDCGKIYANKSRLEIHERTHVKIPFLIYILDWRKTFQLRILLKKFQRKRKSENSSQNSHWRKTL
jgi:hypothetical protein